MNIIVGPSFEHCERHAYLISAALGWAQREDGTFEDRDGSTVMFVVEPRRLLSLPRTSRIYDGFVGLFNHQLAAQFAATLADFDQYFYHSRQEESVDAVA